MERRLRAVFVYPNPRRQLVAAVAEGQEPDSILFGLNHLADEGIAATVHDPLLSRLSLRGPLVRVAWNLRELTVPFEVGRADVLFTTMANALPLAARLRSLPVVVVNFGLNLIWRRAGVGRRALLGTSLRSAAHVVCLGESQRAELSEAVGIAPGRITTMLLPIDERYWSPAPTPPVPGSVLTVGKDLARDYATFLGAVATLDGQVRLAVHPRTLEGLALPSTVRAGLVPTTELRDEYARAACVVLPQRRDDFPYGSEGGGLTALLEAMAMGKPIVASERAILRDYVTDGVDGLLVPPEDPAAMREAIERVLGDGELAARLGSAARARVERAHTSRAFAAGLARLFRAVV